MKILVAVKRVIDYNVQVRVKNDGTGVEKENVKMSMNPPDENAVEEALRIKESGKADEIVILSIGVEKSQETIRTALAMGADRGILIKTDHDVEPLGVSKLIAKISLNIWFLNPSFSPYTMEFEWAVDLASRLVE